MLIAGLANLGLLSLGALCFYMMSRRVEATGALHFRNIAIGLCFGLLSVLVVNTPIALPIGATFDTRAAPAVLAGFFAGPVGGLICAAIAGAARFYVGGPMAVGGGLSPFIYALLGMAAGHLVFTKLNRNATAADFTVLGVLSCIVVLPCFFVDQGFAFGASVLADAWHLFLLGNVSGILVLGLLTEDVRRAIASHNQTKRDLFTSQLARASGEVAVWRHDFVAKKVIWDDAMFRIYGLRPDQFSGTPGDWEKRVLPEDLAEIEVGLNNSAQTGDRFGGQYRIRRANDDAVRWIQVHCQFFQDARGHLTEAIGLNWDITERKTLEENLRQKEREARDRSLELEATLTAMNHGVCVYDRQGRLKLWNGRIFEIFSLPATTSLSDMPFCDFRALRSKGAEAIQTFEDMQKVLTTGDVIRDQVELADRTVVSITISPMPDGGWVETHVDVTEKAIAEQRIRAAAETDALTGLANRTVFNSALEKVLQSASRGVRGQALMLIDLNDFKVVNDSFGHLIGDRLLKSVADLLKSHAGQNGLAVRLGGDEFALLVWEIDRQKLERLVDQIIADIRRPQDLGGTMVEVGVSIGISCITPEDKDPEAVLIRADGALYKAKSAGCCHYRFFDDDIEQEILTRRRLKSQLVKDLQNKRLETWFQPIVSTGTQEFLGAEALVRWRRSDGTFTPPTEFIPLAEEAGLIGELGRIVLCQALEAASSWPDHTKVAVNVSPRQLGGGALVTQVLNALDTYRFAPDRLELEITENILIDGNHFSLNDLDRLAEAGVSIVLDDFGTGYSSMSYLHRLPLTKMKIDRSFVMDMEENRNCAAIVAAMTNLAVNLGLDCTAEGIETEAQLSMLRTLGCSQGQGYLFAGPMPASDLTAWLDSHVAVPDVGCDSEATPHRLTSV